MQGKKRNISWLLTRKWKVGIWCTRRYNFNFRKLCPSLHRDQRWRLSLAWHSCWSSPSFCLLCSLQPDLRIAFAQLVYVDKTFHFIQGNKKSKLICQKWRNFDKISLKEFNQIEAKNKRIAKYFLSRLQKNLFCKKCEQKLVSFSKGIFKFIWAFFLRLKLFSKELS